MKPLNFNLLSLILTVFVIQSLAEDAMDDDAMNDDAMNDEAMNDEAMNDEAMNDIQQLALTNRLRGLINHIRKKG